MSDKTELFKIKLQALVDHWQDSGLPGRQTLMDTAQDLMQWKSFQSVNGLWPSPPVFLTATLDDAWGHGLELIETYAEVMGLTVISLGLEKTAAEIITGANDHNPDYLGMTVLQFDSEEELIEISRHIPERTKVIAGGPIFKSDPDIARRTGVHFTAKDVTAFVQYFLSNC